MSKIVILLSFIFSFSVFAQSKNHMLIMGAGSEPKDVATTIFDEDINKMGKFMENNPHWKPKVSFNGGHMVTEMIMETGIAHKAGPNIPFTEESYERMISDYEKKINSGEIKNGDQLIVYISTHGAKNGGDVKSHKIGTTGKAAGDLNTLKDATTVSVDRLQNLISLAEKKGVKLGILDFSCHSGATLALNNPKTCIISSTGPDHFGYNGFGPRFIDNMAKGRTLEDVFLKTFVNRPELAFPMISTPVGMELQKELYELVTPYLFDWNPKPSHDKLQSLIERQVVDNKCEEANLKFGKLLDLVNDMQKISQSRSNAFRELRESLTIYHSFQNQMKDSLIKMNLPQLTKKKEKFCTKRIFVWQGKPEDNMVCDEWTHKEMMGIDYDNVIEKLEARKGFLKGNDLTFAEASIGNLKKAKNQKDVLIFQNPGYKEYETFFQSQAGLKDKTWDLGLDVSKKLQKVYEEVYQSRAKTDSRPNACKNIVI